MGYQVIKSKVDEGLRERLYKSCDKREIPGFANKPESVTNAFRSGKDLANIGSNKNTFGEGHFNSAYSNIAPTRSKRN